MALIRNHLPKHVAIIMDGNGRWAQSKRRPRVFGHIRGSSRVRPLVRECGGLGIQYLTLYCFSSENWGRPDSEISILFRLLKKYLSRELKTLMQNNVRFQAIGDLEKLPLLIQEIVRNTTAATKNNSGLTLTFALSYGSRDEITSAVKKIAKLVENGTLSSGAISEETISQNLWMPHIPDPDLVIRTSGEIRLSNFLLWQTAYSELYFTDVCWPDFDIQELHRALATYVTRTRRFGLTDTQTSPANQELSQ